MPNLPATPNAPAPASHPVFLTGSSRSGTELLRQILNRHAQVHIAAETHYFADLRPRCNGLPAATAQALAINDLANLRGSAYGLNGTEAVLPHPQRQSDLRAIAGPAATPDDLFLAHCQLGARDAGKDDAAVWGEKCPRHIFHVAQILASFPGARIVFMLRDPCAVAASYRDWTNHWYNGRTPHAALSAALQGETQRVQQMESLTLSSLMWRGAVQEAQRMQAKYGTQRIRIQSFERLLTSPQTEIADLCQFLNIPMDAAMLKIPRVNSSYGPQGQSEPLDQAAATGWKTRMSDREIWWVRRLTASLAQPLGYGPATTGPHPFFAGLEAMRFVNRLPKVIFGNRARKPQYMRRLVAALRRPAA